MTQVKDVIVDVEYLLSELKKLPEDTIIKHYLIHSSGETISVDKCSIVLLAEDGPGLYDKKSMYTQIDNDYDCDALDDIEIKLVSQ